MSKAVNLMKNDVKWKRYGRCVIRELSRDSSKLQLHCLTYTSERYIHLKTFNALWSSNSILYGKNGTWQAFSRQYTTTSISPCCKRSPLMLFSQLRAIMSATVQVLSMVCVRRRTFVSVILDT